MDPSGKHIRRPAVGVVGGVVDKLVVGGQPCRGSERIAVIGLDDLLGSRMRQHAVAYQNAQTSIIEELLMHFGNAVDHTGNADRVVRPAP